MPFFLCPYQCQKQTYALGVYSVLLPAVELFSEDSKSLLVYKLHTDYSKIYPSLISIVLSLEKIY